MVPPLSVTRNVPSGRKASENGELRRVVMVSTLSAGEGFAGLGASVCLGKAGLGLGGLPVNADCAQTGAKAAVKKAEIANRRTYAMSNIMSYIGFFSNARQIARKLSMLGKQAVIMFGISIALGHAARACKPH